MAKTPTTDEALCAFLAGERGRLSARSMRNYEYAVELLRDSLNGYGPNRLAGWLFEHGYVSADEREDGVEHGSRASRDLPRAERLANLLYEQSRSTPPFDPDALGSKDLVEDYPVIERVEPGKLYFSRGIGPLEVFRRASELAHVG